MKPDTSICQRVGTAPAVLIFLACLVFFPIEANADMLVSAFSKFLSPGQLSGPHAHEEKLKDCYACHTLTQGIDDALCLDCHKVVAQRIANESGYHGGLKGRCETCHTEHKGNEADIIGMDQKAFNHRLANYHLTGKHAEIDCSKCHPKKEADAEPATRYIGVKFSTCTECHDDPHPEAMGTDCLKCHTTAGWSGRALVYSHSRDSEFKLQGKHQAVKCEKCHEGFGTNEKFRLPKKDCLECHEDIHKGEIKKQCEQCHNESGWTGKNLLFAHNRDSEYKLTGAHQTLPCDKCHKESQPGAKLATSQFSSLKTNCLQCHTDEHQQQLAKECQTCHSEFGWKRPFLKFKHNDQSSFKLDATHETVACDECHKNKRYKPLESKCVDCHADYGFIMAGSVTDGPPVPTMADPHWGRVRCDQCHDGQFKKQSLPLYEEKCVTCHNERYGPLLLDWMKDWFVRRYEVQTLLQQAEQAGVLPAETRERLSRKLTDAEKVGAHNFQLAPLEWNRLKSEVEHALPEGSFKVFEESRVSQRTNEAATPFDHKGGQK